MRGTRLVPTRLAALALGAAVLLGCGGPVTPPESTVLDAAQPASSVISSDSAGTGNHSAVLVAADYRPPRGRVDSTGAYLPMNGKPSLVFVDAIW